MTGTQHAERDAERQPLLKADFGSTDSFKDEAVNRNRVAMLDVGMCLPRDGA